MTTSHTTRAWEHRRLHLQISDLRSGHRKVDIHVPVNLAAVALRSGACFLPRGHDPQTLMTALDSGTPLELTLQDENMQERFVISIQ